MEPRAVVRFSGHATAEAVLQQLLTQNPSFFEDTLDPSLRAKVPYNQPFCNRLKSLADTYKRDAKRENLSKTLDRARNNISQHPAPLCCKKDFLNVKGVGPYVARILEEVLESINSRGASANGSSTISRSADALADIGVSPAITRRRSPELKENVGEPSKPKRKKQKAEAETSASSSSGLERVSSLPVPRRSASTTSSLERISTLLLPERSSSSASGLDRVSSLPARLPSHRAASQSTTEVIELDEDSDGETISRRAIAQNAAVASTATSSSSMLVATSTLQQAHFSRGSSSPSEERFELSQRSVFNHQTEGSSLQRSSSFLYTRQTSAMPQQVPASRYLFSPKVQVQREVLLPSFAECILLLDQREIGSMKERHFFENKLRSLGCNNVQVRSLPLGDVMWVIRDRRNGQEYVCDTILERKTVDDLGTSIKDGRFKEQQFRLLDSRLERLLYLIEGDIARVQHIPVQSLETSIIHSRLAGLIVHLTSSRESTCDYLMQLHDSIETKFRNGHYTVDDDRSWSNYLVSSKREGCETVRELFQSMLVQIPGCSSDKARAITLLYPTPAALLRAYSENKLDDKEKEWKRRLKLLEDIKCGPARRRLGPKLSATIAQLFCLAEYTGSNRNVGLSEEEDYEEDEDDYYASQDGDQQDD